MRKILILLMLFLPVCLMGQEGKSNSIKNDTLSTQINEVIITALRYPEGIMEVPMAISLIKKQDLIGIRGLGIDEPLASVPGVLAQSRAGGTDVRVTIRGFGARGAGDRSNSGTSRGLRFYIDGLPETEPDGRTSLDLFDMTMMDHVEVIRSNASSIWGNASGGVITYSTLPYQNKSFLDIGYLGGSYGLMKINVDAASAFENGMVKASYVKDKYDGYRENSSQERDLFNVSLRTDNPNLTVHLTGAHNLFYIPGPLTKNMYDTLPDAANPKYLANKERRDNRILRIGATFQKDLGEGQSISAMAFAAPKYLQRSERGTYRDFNRYHLGGSMNYKNSFNISSLDNILLAGIDNQYQNGSCLFYKLDANSNRSTTLSQNKAEGANNFGAFLQDEIFIGEFSILLGARYDDIIYHTQDYISGKSEVRSYGHVTPKLGLSYELDKGHYVYASLGGGVEVPAGNETDPSPYLGQDTIYIINPLLDPIVSTTYEIGSKNSEMFGNGFLQGIDYDLAAFYIMITNDIIPYQGGKFYFTAGKSSRVGIEGKLGLKFHDGLNFNAAITFMQSQYDEYLVDSVHYDPSKEGKFADYSGNKTAGIPGLFYNAGLEYTPTFLSDLSIGISMMGVGEYYADDANQFTVPSYNILNAKASYALRLEGIHTGFRLVFGINNLLDSKYAASAYINPEIEKSTGLPFYLETGLPMNMYFGISLNID